MRVREENEKRRAALKGGVQGKRRMSRAASYLQARNQEGEEVPPQNSDNEKNQSRSTEPIITITSPQKCITIEKALPYLIFLRREAKKKVAGSCYLPSNPLPLAWPLEMRSVLTRKLPEQKLLPRAYLSQPWSGQLGEGGQGSAFL